MPDPIHMLSIIIITKNEAANIRHCLESVKWADEIIVLDSGSTDTTVAICLEYTDKVFVTDWPGFGAQKNRALAKASGEWVLSIDADEEVSPALAEEIRSAISSKESFAAYQIPRMSSYCGRMIKFGDWRGDKVTRLFKKECGHFTDRIIHERLLVDGSIGTLKNSLTHYSFKDLSQVLAKVNHYSTAGAEQRFEQGRKVNLLSAIGRGLWTFLRGYLLKFGFFDGREGFLLACSNALGTFYTYTKLNYLWQKFPPTTVIITTYNRPDALEQVLLSLNQQTILPTEIIVADDGSTENTAALIKTMQARVNYSLLHIWQPDAGFQAAKIRNKAAAMAQGDYLIFLDGDCVLLPNFIAQHKRLAEKNWFVAGNRILLSQALTNQLLQSSQAIYQFNFWQWLQLYFSRGCNRLLPLFTLPLGILRKISAKKWQGAKTCNLAVWKQDFFQVNGFDESFIGWGYEDSDLVIRLIRNGVKRKSGKFAAPVIHFWHAENDRRQEADNLTRLLQVELGTEVWAKNGIDQYRSQD